jgi:tetratricopeptide (TPR) repeat protein
MERLSLKRLALILAFLALFGGAAAASTGDEIQAAQELLTRYGKLPIVNLIIERRSGFITIQRNQEQTEFHGKPNMDYVTADTLLIDMRLMGMSLDSFRAMVEEDAKKRMDKLTKAIEAEGEEVREAQKREFEERRAQELEERRQRENRAIQEANAMRARGDVAGALKTLSGVIRANPGNADAWFSRSHLRMDLEQWDAALSDCRQVLAINPDHTGALVNLGKAYMGKNLPRDAILSFQKIAAGSPDNHEARYWQAKAYAMAGDLRLAQEGAKEAERLNPGLLQYQQFVKEVQAAIQIRNGKLKAKNGAHSGAVDDYSKAIHLNPLNAEAYLLRGQSYLAINWVEEALGDFNRAIEFGLTNAEPYFWRSRAFQADGQMKNAVKDAEEALRKDQGNKDYKLRLEEVQGAAASSKTLVEQSLTALATLLGLGLVFGLYWGGRRLRAKMRMRALREEEKKEALKRETTAGKSKIEERIRNAILEAEGAMEGGKAEPKAKKEGGPRGSIEMPDEFKNS